MTDVLAYPGQRASAIVISAIGLCQRRAAQALGATGLEVQIWTDFAGPAPSRPAAMLVLDLDLDPAASPEALVAKARKAVPQVPIIVVAGVQAEARLLEALTQRDVNDAIPKRGAGRASTQPGTQGPAWPDEHALYSAVRRRLWGIRGVRSSLLDRALRLDMRVASSGERHPVIARIAGVLRGMSLPDEKIARVELMCEELVMNALFDAPRNGERPRFADIARMIDVRLPEHEAATLRFGTDGQAVVISVADPFGALDKHSVLARLRQVVDGPALPRSGISAGVGLVMVYAVANQLIFEVQPGELTEVTAVLHVAGTTRDIQERGTSLHFHRQAKVPT